MSPGRADAFDPNDANQVGCGEIPSTSMGARVAPRQRSALLAKSNERRGQSCPRTKYARRPQHRDVIRKASARPSSAWRPTSSRPAHIVPKALPRASPSGRPANQGAAQATCDSTSSSRPKGGHAAPTECTGRAPAVRERPDGVHHQSVWNEPDFASRACGSASSTHPFYQLAQHLPMRGADIAYNARSSVASSRVEQSGQGENLASGRRTSAGSPQWAGLIDWPSLRTVGRGDQQPPL